MICAFDHGSLVKDVMNRMKANNIDEKYAEGEENCARIRWATLFRKLVQYCMLKGYLRRVREYYISLDDATPTSNGNHLQAAMRVKFKANLRDLCDGTNDTDSLACLGYSKFDDRLRRSETSVVPLSRFQLARLADRSQERAQLVHSFGRSRHALEMIGSFCLVN